MNTIHSPSILNSSASASWIPVCLPKFNPAGFVNAYISFMQMEDEGGKAGVASGKTNDTDAETPTRDDPRPDNEDGGHVVTSERIGPGAHEPEAGIALICISGGGEFESVRTWCNTVTKVRLLVIHRSGIIFSYFPCLYRNWKVKER